MVPDPGSLALVLGMVGRSDANGNGRCCSDGRMRSMLGCLYKRFVLRG
jgi:hypothetical protein